MLLSSKNKVVLPANIVNFRSLELFIMSFICIKNSIYPNTVP